MFTLLTIPKAGGICGRCSTRLDQRLNPTALPYPVAGIRVLADAFDAEVWSDVTGS